MTDRVAGGGDAKTGAVLPDRQERPKSWRKGLPLNSISYLIIDQIESVVIVIVWIQPVMALLSKMFLLVSKRWTHVHLQCCAIGEFLFTEKTLKSFEPRLRSYKEENRFVTRRRLRKPSKWIMPSAAPIWKLWADPMC